MLDIVSYVVFSSQKLFPWNFGLKGFNFGDFSYLQIVRKNLMAIPSPQKNSADQAQFALNLKVIPLKLFNYQTFLKLDIINIHDMNSKRMQ